MSKHNQSNQAAAAAAEAEAAAAGAVEAVEADDLSGKSAWPLFLAVGRERHEPFQNIRFPEGVPTPAQETAWVLCQVEAGILARA